MRIQYLGSAATLSFTILLSSTAGSSGTPAAASHSNARPGSIALAPNSDIDLNDAARLAKQASFGPTPELIDTIAAKRSVAAWLEEQFTLTGSSYADLAAKAVPGNYCDGLSGTELSGCTRDNFSTTRMQMRFYANAVVGQDQLRQRVAFALSQIIVASETEVHNTSGLATFQQILLSNSFGNYRDILKEVTLNPFMGDYLDMADSNKNQPNENYARELMQLFSIGTIMLNADSTPLVDNSGNTIPTYSNNDVKEISRALTGWTYARLNGAPTSNYTYRDLSKSMIKESSRFDPTSKTFLGTTIQGGATQDQNIDAVIDAIFNHPNVGPFVCKRLIQQLTVSNPTPSYVERVSSTFADNGRGVRGDMKAVVRAIYLDSEARTVSQTPGKVKEPILLSTALARAIGFKTDGYTFLLRDTTLGQAPFRAPSVFNFYNYDFPLPQGAHLLSPASKLMTTSNIANRHNLVFEWTVNGDTTRDDFKPVLTTTGTTPDWASWEAYGTDDGKILDRIDLVLLNGTMTAAQRRSLLTAMAAVKNSDPKAQTRKRAQVALYIVASSPLFQVDR